MTRSERRRIPCSPGGCPRLHKRMAAAAALLLALTASGCGSSAAPGTEETDGQVELRFSWWGNSDRAELTQRAIDTFEDAHPNITVKPEFADFNGYFDRLATTVAGGDAPDVITLGGAYPREYGDRGALMDLTEVSGELDLGKLPESALANGNFSGIQYGVPTGNNTYALLINPRVFEEAGVPLPDEDTWSWEDYAETAEAISAKSPDGVFGTADPTSMEALDVYAWQNGESVYSEDGGMNIEAETLADWWDMTAELRASGAAPDAALSAELDGLAGPEQSLMGRGLSGMEFAWSNQYAAYQSASGDPLQLIRPPGESHAQPGVWLQASQIYSIYSQTEHPKEAAALIDFLINDPEAAKIIGTDRGIPSNPDVLEAIQPELTEAQQVESQFVGRMGEYANRPLIIGPVGSTNTLQILERVNSGVLFEQITPEEAGKQFIDEVSAAIGAK
ncbi:multiple sugar transport system substrate-binding protein [Arthrobacter sp. UYP6]